MAPSRPKPSPIQLKLHDGPGSRRKEKQPEDTFLSRRLHPRTSSAGRPSAPPKPRRVANGLTGASHRGILSAPAFNAFCKSGGQAAKQGLGCNSGKRGHGMAKATERGAHASQARPGTGPQGLRKQSNCVGGPAHGTGSPDLACTVLASRIGF